MENKNLKNLSITELIDYEKGAALICKKYENTVQSMPEDERNHSAEYIAYMKFYKKYIEIITEIEKRIENI